MGSRRMLHPSVIFPETPDKVCRVCKGKCKGRRWAFCSAACQHAYTRVGHWNTLRRWIGKRDKYVCALCGIDCKWQKRLHFETRPDPTNESVYADWMEAAVRMAGSNDISRDWWSVDHIVPVCEWVEKKHGVNVHAETNLRVLCWPCHKEETWKLARRRKLYGKAKGKGRRKA